MGKNVSVLRALLLFSQQQHFEVAKAVGMSPDALSRLANGRCDDRPRRKDLEAIADWANEHFNFEHVVISPDLLLLPASAYDIVVSAQRLRKIISKGP